LFFGGLFKKDSGAKSIAFDNLSPAKDDAYFGDGRAA
jgi:hypothetical protein